MDTDRINQAVARGFDRVQAQRLALVRWSRLKGSTPSSWRRSPRIARWWTHGLASRSIGRRFKQYEQSAPKVSQFERFVERQEW